MFIVILLDYYEKARDENLKFEKDQAQVYAELRRKDPFTKLHKVSHSLPELIAEAWHFIFPRWHIQAHAVGGLFCYRPSDGSPVQGPFRYRCAQALHHSREITDETSVWLMQVVASSDYTAQGEGELSFKR